MQMLTSESGGLWSQLVVRARAEGLADCRVTEASYAPAVAGNLSSFVAAGYHGGMTWMESTLQRRSSPQVLWPQARSAIVVSLNYGQDLDHAARLREKSFGVISVYALNRDYHDLLKAKLKRLAQWLAHTAEAEVKIFTDTAPLMEKPLAEKAGLGWQGKHTNLVSRRQGSWFFLGVILTDFEFEPSNPEIDHCGSCQACLTSCPTNAFPRPRELDARRCISYLTIEHKGHIDTAFRKAMGNRIYGCDDCLAVCPWNKFAALAHEQKLLARHDLVAPPLSILLGLDDKAFRTMFSRSPVKRVGRDSFIRNCLIAAGNSQDQALIGPVTSLLLDASPLVRAMAVWALKQLNPHGYHKAPPTEQDQHVLLEWAA